MHHSVQSIACHTVLPDYPAYRGEGMHITCGYHHTLIGDMFLALNGDCLCYLGFEIDGNRDLPLTLMKKRFPSADIVSGDVSVMAERVVDLWRGNLDKTINIELHGTEFQVSVWQALLEIPYGQTACYRDIARHIGQAKSTRAVGSAVGVNPVSLLVPCHRVLPMAGGTGQYLWGRALKKHILTLESEDAGLLAA